MDDIMRTTYEVWVKTDERGRVIALDGGVTMSNVDINTWVKIDEGTDHKKYGGCQQHYIGMPLYTYDLIPRYKLIGTDVVLRDVSEIETDRARNKAQKKMTLEVVQISREDYDLLDVPDEETIYYIIERDGTVTVRKG